MDIDLKSWHGRLYLWTLRQWLLATWRDSIKINGNRYWRQSLTYRDTAEMTTNLCHYIRTLFVYLPILMASNAITIGCFLAVFMYPMQFFGAGIVAGNVFWFTVVILAVGLAVGAVIGTIVGTCWLYENVETARNVANASGRPVKSFFVVLFTWIEDRHEKLCTTVTLTRSRS